MSDNTKQEFAYASYPDLQGKRVVVTGGGSGIGAELTTAFAGQGARVVFLDIAEEASRGLEDSLRGSVHPPKFIKCDLTNLDELAAVFARIEQELGGVDILLNNAANDDRHEIEDVTPEYWDNRMNVNLRHKFFCTQAVLPGMLERGSGHLLQTASAAGLLTTPGDAPYTVSKHGAVALAEWMAITYGGRGIKVSVVCPMGVETPLLMDGLRAGEPGAQAVAASGEIISPEQVADAVVEGLAAERFLILPHPQVGTFWAQKASDPDRWLAGVRRLIEKRTTDE